MTLEDLKIEIAATMEAMRPLLPKGPGAYELTFVARIPGHPEWDMAVSADDALLRLLEPILAHTVKP